jgi:hypothetical protein
MCCEIEYADLVAGGARLGEMFSFLGESIPEADVRAILAERHSYVTDAEHQLRHENRRLRQTIAKLQG